MTPMLIVIIALGTTDLLFALDSIPAIYGLTEEPYLVFAANVFALMGLRSCTSSSAACCSGWST
jgi:tellurite resistance protein TerC